MGFSQKDPSRSELEQIDANGHQTKSEAQYARRTAPGEEGVLDRSNCDYESPLDLQIGRKNKQSFISIEDQQDGSQSQSGEYLGPLVNKEMMKESAAALKSERAGQVLKLRYEASSFSQYLSSA